MKSNRTDSGKVTARCLWLAISAAMLVCSGCGVTGNEIVVCGDRISIGTPVVLWTGAGGFNAYAPSPAESTRNSDGKCYRPGRSWAANGDVLDSAKLAEGIDLFVLHYDACGTSRRCFEVLHQKRGLSVHFLLDLDGTIYQTLDLRDQAWHAREANPRSIGVEIANIGAFPEPSDTNSGDSENSADSLRTGLPNEIRNWYRTEKGDLRISLPPLLANSELAKAGPLFSATRTIVRGDIHGTRFAQADFTPQQYEALARLTAGLHRVFPRIRLEVPRDQRGSVRANALAPVELAGFSGIIGHYHITTDKIDPGPAFNWEKLLQKVRSPDAKPQKGELRNIRADRRNSME